MFQPCTLACEGHVGGMFCNSTDAVNQVEKRHVPFLDTSFENLSTEEKESVRRDVYGLEDGIIDESDEFVDGKLDELGSELRLLSQKVKSAYMQAIDMELNQQGGEEYVTSRKFRVMFLRAERFDARLAARRLAMYFQEKLKLFGKEKLASKIKEDDLNEKDREALYSGIYSLTGATDKAGRIIAFVHRQVRIFETDMNITNLKRAIFYFSCVQLEHDEISQKRGVVGIAYNVGPWDVRQASLLRKFIPLGRFIYRAACCRISAFHHCYDSPLYELFLNTMLVVQPKDVRDRIQCHYGAHEVCLAELVPYGIDPDNTPYNADGGIRMDMIRRYMEILKQLRLVADNKEEC